MEFKQAEIVINDKIFGKKLAEVIDNDRSLKSENWTVDEIMEEYDVDGDTAKAILDCFAKRDIRVDEANDTFILRFPASKIFESDILYLLDMAYYELECDFEDNEGDITAFQFEQAKETLEEIEKELIRIIKENVNDD